MIEIRRAQETDARTLADLGRTTFIETFAKDNSGKDIELFVAETYGADLQLKEIKDPNRRIEIAWLANEAAGFLHLLSGTADPAITGTRPIEILRLYVDSKWHGKGVGVALMDRCLHIAREEGFQTVWLGVWERNFRAQAFYKKYGFATVGKHVFRVGTDDQTDLLMVRSIVSPTGDELL